MSHGEFFACNLDHEAIFLQYWSGNVKFTFLDQYHDFLQCRNHIVLLNVKRANYHFDIVKQLIDQNNYIILMDIGEVGANVPCGTYQDLVRDCPGLADAPLIAGGDNQEKCCVNLETFFFETLSDNNILHAKTYTIDQIYSTPNKPYTFLYLNGADYPHRNRLWHTLKHQNLLENALCSYLGYNPFGSQCDIPMKVLQSQYESPWVDLGISDQLQRMDHRDYLNFKSKFYSSGYVPDHVVPAQYINSYFTLVTETIVAENCRFMTEKTYKPLLAGHPFIVLSTPGHYKYLHKLGFETWPELIDESFDDEIDVDVRIDMIARQVKKLCSNDLQTFLNKAEPICRYNHEHYLAYRSNLFRQVHERLISFFDAVRTMSSDFFAGKTIESSI